jgi:prephenate dehydrogenase
MTESKSYSPKSIFLYSVGLLGGSLGLALKTSGYTGRIVGFSSPRGLQEAKKLGCIDEGYAYDTLPEHIGDADLLVICSPINAILSCLESLAGMDLPEGLLITDVGSTKEQIVATAGRTLPPHVHFLGGHPMAGSEKRGPSAADPYLFQNAIYVLTPPGVDPDPRDRAFAAFLQRYLGCKHVFLDPAVHDTIAATVSHVPHMMAVALVNVAQSMDDRIGGTLDLAAGGFRDMTRIASAPYSVWHDILTTNKKSIAPVLDECIARLQNMKTRLGDDTLGGLFDDAAKTRRRVPSRGKGFISPPSEVLVVAKDQPGIIAAISNSLADRKINIKDIEVVKVREGEGGTIRLAFDSRDTARTAIDILKATGFTAWERI